MSSSTKAPTATQEPGRVLAIADPAYLDLLRASDNAADRRAQASAKAADERQAAATKALIDAQLQASAAAVAALDRQAAALASAPRMDLQTIVVPWIGALITHTQRGVDAIAQRVREGLAVLRIIESTRAGVQPLPPSPLPQPAIEPVSPPNDQPIRVPQPTPRPLADVPAELSEEQTQRYLMAFRDEFAAHGITTIELARKHWREWGREEWLKGLPERRRLFRP